MHDNEVYGVFYRFMTKKERVISGLSTGHDAPLIVREGGIAGRFFLQRQPFLKAPGCVNIRPQKSIPLLKNQHMRRCMRSTMKDATLWNLLMPFLM